MVMTPSRPAGRPRRWVLTAGLASAAGLFGLRASAQSPARLNMKEPAMPVQDALFAQVPLNSRLQNNCSPAEPPLPWQGLLIQAPTQVGFRPGKQVDERFAIIPICGYYRLEMTKLMGGAPLTLVAVNTADQSRYTGAVIDEDPGHPAPRRGAPPPLTADDVNGVLSASYFNPNLARYVALPAVEAVYRVHAEYGGAVSNAVQIAVVRR
jgi:hypothetical protein